MYKTFKRIIEIVATTCAFMVIAYGIQFISIPVAGKEEGKRTVMYALVGLVIAILACVTFRRRWGVLAL